MEGAIKRVRPFRCFEGAHSVMALFFLVIFLCPFLEVARWFRLMLFVRGALEK